MLNLKKVSKTLKSKLKLIVPKNKVIKTFVLLVLSLFLILSSYNLIFIKKISPGIYVANYKLGGKSHEEAKLILSQFTAPEKIVLLDSEEKYEIDLTIIDLNYDIDDSVKAAENYTKTGNFLVDQIRRITLPFKNKNLGLRLNLDEKLLEKELESIIEKVSTPPVEPEAKYISKNVIIEKGKPGVTVDLQYLMADVENALSNLDSNPVIIVKTEVDKSINDEEALKLKERAETLVGKTLMINFEYSSYPQREIDVFPFLDPRGEYLKDPIEDLVDTLSEKTNREPQNSMFNFEGGRVKEFVPSKDGVEVKKEELINMIIGNLRTLEETEENVTSFEIPVKTTPPDVTTDEVNNLGINELIGRGTSTFRGSISSRVYNIGIASSRLNGIIVKPGQVFSFNANLGEVSNETGYKQAYIIKEGSTVLDDGGGVCQVSTTLFRAVLDAGLPVVERRAHAYRVSYYEQDRPVGFDATVYSPTTDFKFKNDTSGHLLIQTIYNARSASLIFEIYGTNDGRTSSTTYPIIWDVTPPPEDLYTDDPNLPTGTIKQIDYKSWGSKAKFTYSVSKGGEETYRKVFYSSYSPWQAKFLRGTGPVQ